MGGPQKNKDFKTKAMPNPLKLSKPYCCFHKIIKLSELVQIVDQFFSLWATMLLASSIFQNIFFCFGNFKAPKWDRVKPLKLLNLDLFSNLVTIRECSIYHSNIVLSYAL